jgi:hypothetical protein
VIAWLYEAAEQAKARRRRFEEQERRWAEEARQRAEAEQRRREEADRVAGLGLIRRFVDAAEAAARTDGEIEAGSEFDLWARWARQHAEGIDPLTGPRPGVGAVDEGAGGATG